MPETPKLKAWGWPTALGALAALALPPLHVLPALWVGLSMLLRRVDRTPGPRGAFAQGWWFGFGLNIVGLYWVTEAILFEADRFWWLIPIAVPMLAATLAVFVGLATAVARIAPDGWGRAFALAGAWGLSDLARQFFLSGFPWNPLGSVWEATGTFGDIMIQPASIVGVHGLTVVTVLIAALPSRGWRAAAVGIACLLPWAGWGTWSLRQAMPTPKDAPWIVVLQGNVPQGHRWTQEWAQQIFGRYIGLAMDGVSAAPNVPVAVLWPETASPFPLENDSAAREAIAQVSARATSFVGSFRFDAKRSPHNSLIVVGHRGEIEGVFDKAHLVPFGEFQPNWFPLNIELVPGGGFVPGSGAKTLHPADFPPVGPLICYEAIFPGEGVDRSDRPRWLANVTNDAWFGNSSGPRQHLAAARMRAVEEGLPLARAANTGISAVFDAHGREIARLDVGVTGQIAVPLPPPEEPTIFAKFGLLIPGSLSVAALAVGLFGLTRRRR